MRLRILLCAFAVFVTPLLQAAESPSRIDSASVTRGRYLTAAGDCVACHTVPGGTPFAGGLPLRTPFGTLLSSNITPDRETGLGGWTQEQFRRALKVGIGGRGQHLYPAMPYNDYARMTDQDVRDIKAYLDSLPPAKHEVQTNQLSFPFNIRLAMVGWNLLFFDRSPFRANPSRDATWNRGAYLVEGLGHCGACHTPKNFLGGDRSGSHLAGTQVGNWYAPALNSDVRTGMGNWSVQEIVDYLKTGSTARAVAAGPMADVVSHSTQYLTDADLRAIAIYLKSLAPEHVSATPPTPPSQAMMRAGRAVFEDNCSACHAVTGTGIPGMAPALAEATSVQAIDPASILHVILHGGRDAATSMNPTGAGMPAFDWKLTDEQIAAVTTFIRNSWNNRASAVSPESVGQARKTLDVAVPHSR